MKKTLLALTFGVIIAMMIGCYSIVASAAISNPAIKRGDVNNDGYTDSLDAATILKYDAALIDLSAEQMVVGDFNEDGYVDSLDAASILKYDCGYDFSITRQSLTDVPVNIDIDENGGELSIPLLILEQADGTSKGLACNISFVIDGDRISGEIISQTLVENGKTETSITASFSAILALKSVGTFTGTAEVYSIRASSLSTGEKIELATQLSCAFELSVSQSPQSGCVKYRITLITNTAQVASGTSSIGAASIKETALFEDMFVFDIAIYNDRVEIDINHNYESVTATETTTNVSVSLFTHIIDSGNSKAFVVIKEGNNSYLMDIEAVTKEFSNSYTESSSKTQRSYNNK